MTNAPMPAEMAAAPVGAAMRFVIEQIRRHGAAPLEAFLALHARLRPFHQAGHGHGRRRDRRVYGRRLSPPQGERLRG